MNAPSASRVAERALASLLLRARADVENLARADERRAREAQELLARFAADAGLVPALEDRDEWLLAKPAGTLDLDATQDASWSVEVAQVLAWALGLVPTLSAHDHVAAEGLARTLGLLRAPVAREVIANARLRAHDELAVQARNVILVRHSVTKKNVPSMPDDVHAKTVDRALGELGLVPSTADERQAVLASLEGVLRAPATGKLYSVRLQAFEWLLGARATFWDPPTSTPGA